MDIVLTDVSVTVGGTDLSNHVQKVTLSVKADEQDSTAFGSTWHSRVGGLKDWSVKLDFKQDFSAGAVDATVWPLLGTTPTVVVKPTSGALSATNPGYSGAVLVADYTPLDGSVGDLAKTSLSWNGAGTLSRLTA